MSEVITRAQHLLSRYAESINWLARYLERIENLARIIDVTDTFMRTGGGAHGWTSIVQINADETAFFERHQEATPESVIDFYVLDREHPGSIVRMVAAARENARTLRPLISTEMWSHLNMFHNHIRALTPHDIEISRVNQLCRMLRLECQTHAGITEGTIFRDQAWYFYMIGKHMERADQITRLVDIKYHTLLPATAGVGSPVDISQWNTVLRAAAAYHAFRRATNDAMTPGSVAGFLLLSNGFPRSLPACVRAVGSHLTQLRTDYGLRGCARPLERLDDIRAALVNQTITDILVLGLHEFLDYIQLELIGLQADIAAAFWAEQS